MRAFLLAALALALPAHAQVMERIGERSAITLGYIDGAAPFSSSDAQGEPQGYSVDLCRAVAEGIAAQLGRERLEIRWVKLTVQNRIDAVRRGEVDLECSTTTWTLSRQGLVDFSLVTFVDGGNLLVGARSGIAKLQDLAGRRVAVIEGTTTEKALRAQLARHSIQAEVLPVQRRDEGLSRLGEARVDAFAADRTTLIGMLMANGGSGAAYRLLDQDFTIEQYALMLPRGDPDFRLAVNRVLARIYRSGEIEKIYQRSLGALGPPSLLLSAAYFIQALSE